MSTPSILPGMAVKVTNPDDIYFQFEGQVQRVADNYAAVLFEGGNWDKLVSFRFQELAVVDKAKVKGK
ncbi:MAG: NAD(P)H dehydrogenase subunit NdhS [Cyanobacteriota bacterium]|nr:NAD(P)H dehydrogenase subunit NdhS [Cyanobacteriota bacterium]